MNIASIGIDLGKTTFHLVALGERNKILLRRKFSRLAIAGLHRQSARVVNRSRGMRGIALHRYCAARARTSGTNHPGAVCEAVPPVERERLTACGSHCRSRDQAGPAFR